MNWLKRTNYTPESAKKFLEDMTSLEGWNILQEYLRDGITIIENEIFNREYMDVSRLERLKDRRKFINDLLHAPEKLIALLEVDKSDLEFDPYG